MLYPADAALVGREPGLPGLGLVLDAEALRERLAERWPEAEPCSARAVYLRYKPRTSCLVAYRFGGPHGELDVHAIARTGAATGKLQKARDRARRWGARPRLFVLDDCAVVVSVFPEDARVPALVRLADPDRRRRLLWQLLRRTPPAGELVRLRYKPERRWVGFVSDGKAPAVVLKAHGGGGFEAGLRGSLAVQGLAPLVAPRLLGALPEHGLVALSWVAGRALGEALLAGQAGPRDVQVAGEALAYLHGGPPAGLPLSGPLAEAHHVLSVAAALASVQPSLAARAESLGREIANRLARQTPLARPTHGDFHASQVLLSEDAAALIDFDEAALADPAVDLGSFLAHLERDACSGRLAPDRVGALGEALLEGYGRRAKRPSDGQLALRTAAALFRVAPQFFRDRDPSWPEETEAALDRVEAHLRECKTPAPAAGRATTPVFDPFGAGRDTGNPFLAAALDPAFVQDRLRSLPGLQARVPGLRLRRIRVVRHKPARRCLIQYDLWAEAQSAG
jgi:Ser/Thr protein kinase RdoA (MazF antagonist)